eukprot:TRINITY_DN5318_c0_g2_i1.p1 TRINITY_DN5318_c0_g2~~TRINITY_DN5318_c0_g2_i1.p1  ORF type:complete len:327 (+),score=42.39 TRINITY_DN5318_c0_g2_i1:50-982(+)
MDASTSRRGLDVIFTVPKSGDTEVYKHLEFIENEHEGFVGVVQDGCEGAYEVVGTQEAANHSIAIDKNGERRVIQRLEREWAGAVYVGLRNNLWKVPLTPMKTRAGTKKICVVTGLWGACKRELHILKELLTGGLSEVDLVVSISRLVILLDPCTTRDVDLHARYALLTSWISDLRDSIQIDVLHPPSLPPAFPTMGSTCVSRATPCAMSLPSSGLHILFLSSPFVGSIASGLLKPSLFEGFSVLPAAPHLVVFPALGDVQRNRGSILSSAESSTPMNADDRITRVPGLSAKKVLLISETGLVNEVIIDA